VATTLAPPSFGQSVLESPVNFAQQRPPSISSPSTASDHTLGGEPRQGQGSSPTKGRNSAGQNSRSPSNRRISQLRASPGEGPEPMATDVSPAAGATAGASRPKRVRTGCLTCRERHLKCDEGMPDCQNCRKVAHHHPLIGRYVGNTQTNS
jgi:Fungal Zn(2)-Cys(6) binuclear cluster domain